jgi:uncharacterized protein (TIGR02996 family)
MMPSVDVMLSAIAADPGDDTAWLALADCLEEQGHPDRAEVVRLRGWLRHQQPDHPERLEREARLQKMLASGVLPVRPTLRIRLTKRKSLELALVPAGRFLMGGPEKARVSIELPARPVTIEKPFYLAVYPVTQSQWIALMSSNPSRFKKANNPVEQLTWHDCVEFCSKLAEQTGRPFRLPTEAEWEYACRAGTTSLYHGGDTLEALEQVGWCSYNDRSASARRTKPVGQHVPNAWGLYDMHGNVLESCYSGERVPESKSGVEVERIVRGGSWGNVPRQCRCSWRFQSRPSASSPWLGCRVLLEVG